MCFNKTQQNNLNDSIIFKYCKMKEIKKNNLLSDNQYLFVPLSKSMVLFEDELILHDIHFIMETISITKPQIKFTFFEKDIELVDTILHRIEQEALKQEALNQEEKSVKNKQKKQVLKHFEEKIRFLFQV
jgi:hypothetical protein